MAGLKAVSVIDLLYALTGTSWRDRQALQEYPGRIIL
jgi:hypothetical protein